MTTKTTTHRKKRALPEGGLRRSKRGHVLVKIKRLDLEGPCVRQFQASTVGASAKEGPGAYQLAFGATPREACDELAKKLSACGYLFEDLEAADKQTRELLATPFKRPGQNPGGPPVKRSEPATATFTFRLPPTLKELVQRQAELADTTPAQLVIDALEFYLAPARGRAVRSTQ